MITLKLLVNILMLFCLVFYIIYALSVHSLIVSCRFPLMPSTADLQSISIVIRWTPSSCNQIIVSKRPYISASLGDKIVDLNKVLTPTSYPLSFLKQIPILNFPCLTLSHSA